MTNATPQLPTIRPRDRRTGEILTTAIILFAVLALGRAIYIDAYATPRMKAIFMDFGTALPEPTQLLLRISDFTRTWWFVAYPLLAGLLVALVCVTWAVDWRLGLAGAVLLNILTQAYMMLADHYLGGTFWRILQDVRSP